MRTFRDCKNGTEPEPCGLAISPGSEEKSYSSEDSEEISYGSEENCIHYGILRGGKGAIYASVGLCVAVTCGTEL